MELLVTEAGKPTHSLLILQPLRDIWLSNINKYNNNHRAEQSRGNMDASEIDWETINEQLPYDHSEESHARRREIWNGMNVNGNKFLSLAEVDKGIIDVSNEKNKIFTL